MKHLFERLRDWMFPLAGVEKKLIDTDREFAAQIRQFTEHARDLVFRMEALEMTESGRLHVEQVARKQHHEIMHRLDDLLVRLGRIEASCPKFVCAIKDTEEPPGEF